MTQEHPRNNYCSEGCYQVGGCEGYWAMRRLVNAEHRALIDQDWEFCRKLPQERVLEVFSQSGGVYSLTAELLGMKRGKRSGPILSLWAREEGLKLECDAVRLAEKQRVLEFQMRKRMNEER